MKYVMVGDKDNFKFLGIRTVGFERDEDGSEMTCKLESGYTLDIYGDKLSEVFTEFLKSNEMVATLLDEKNEDGEDDYLEVLDSEEKVVYRY